MKKVLLIVLTAIFMLNMIGCTGTKSEAKVGIRGLITKVLVNDSKTVTAIMVEGKVESDTLYDKATVSIEKSTKISIDKEGKKLSSNELKEGMKVEIVFEGPVMVSYPVQGKAKNIKVIK